MFKTNAVEKIKTHIYSSMTFFFEIRAVNEIMWKYAFEPDRPQITVWCIRTAFWIPKATHAPRTQNMFSFPLQKWFHEPLKCFVIRALPVLSGLYRI